MRNRPDPYAGFGHAETPGLTWRDAAPVALGCLSLTISVQLVFGPAFLALTRMF